MGQRVGDDVLGVVGVLVLVDQDVLEPLLQLAQHVGVIAERLGGAQQQVVEIQGVVLRQQLLVLRVNAGDGALVEVAGVAGRTARRETSWFLALLMARVDGAGREVGAGDVQRLERLLDQLGLVGRCRRCVKLAGRPICGGVVPQDAQAQRVERADRSARADRAGRSRAAAGRARSLTRSFISPAALLVKVMARIDGGGDALADQVRHAAGDDARLAAAGPGDDQQRPVHVRDRLALRFGKTFQQLLAVQRVHSDSRPGCQVLGNDRRTIAGGGGPPKNPRRASKGLTDDPAAPPITGRMTNRRAALLLPAGEKGI